VATKEQIMKHVTTDYGRLTIRLPALVHWVGFAWVRSSRVDARKMYLKTLWRWQVGHLVVLVLPRWHKEPW
jgi:hypothetical protein